MRDVVIILVIIGLVFGGGYLTERYLEKSEKVMLDILEELHSQIRQGDMNYFDKALELDKTWADTKVIWHFLANHQEIDAIEVDIKRFVEAYETKNKEEADLLAVEIIFYLNDMHKSEKLDLANIL